MTSRPAADADLRRAFAYLAPYWRRLVLVMAISLISTGLSLVTPYLTKDLVEGGRHALPPPGSMNRARIAKF